MIGFLGQTVAGSAIGTATAHLVDSWLGQDRAYYDSPGSTTSFDYSNNTYRNTNMSSGGHIVSSGANNENCWNSYSSVDVDNRLYSLVRNETITVDQSVTNNTLLYNPVTKNYHTVNNVTYSPDYNTYYMESNDYNYYVTNNYNYISYYVTNITNNTTNYYEMYYELPDGRNSFYLAADEVWGEYFLYDVKRSDVVAEDDGKTLALYHLDENTADSSYHQADPLPLGTGMYAPGMFGNGLQIANNFQIINPASGKQSYTVEFFIKHETTFASGYPYLYLFDVKKNIDITEMSNPGIYHLVYQYDNGNYDVYLNGKKITDTVTAWDDAIGINSNYIYFSVYLNNTDKREFDKPIVLDELRISEGLVYSGNTISVPTEPFDTNKVMVVPDIGSDGDIVVAAPVDISNYRIGGVRPTYPSEGYVHIILDENGTAHEIQQYSSGKWNSCEARIYKDDEWHNLKGFNLESFSAGGHNSTSPGSGDSSDGDSGSGSGSVSGNGNSDSDGGFLSSILDAVGTIFDGILSIVGKAIEYIAKVITLFTETVTEIITVIPSGFSQLMTAVFPFIPSEWIIAIELMLVLSLILIVVGVFKK